MQLLIVLLFHRYEEFHPFLFCQHAKSRYVEFESFNKVCSGFDTNVHTFARGLSLKIRGIINIAFSFLFSPPAPMKLFHMFTSLPQDSIITELTHMKLLMACVSRCTLHTTHDTLYEEPGGLKLK